MIKVCGKMEEIKVHQLGSYGIVKHYMDKLGIYEVFKTGLCCGESLYAESLCIMIMNLIVGVRPLYKISDWLKDYTDGQSEFGYESNAFNDDVLGASLDILYESDRQNLMSAASIRAIKVFELETKQIHNDTTTISFSGSYENQSDPNVVQLKRGYNKDGQRDAKQIVFGLNTCGDGDVPILAQWYNGNTSDSNTHQPNWNALRSLLEDTDFFYIGDSKLATQENMAYLHDKNGKFISILPGTRLEVQEFFQSLHSDALDLKWEVIWERAHTRDSSKTVIYKTCRTTYTQEGYALHWIYSSAKAENEAQARQNRLRAMEMALHELNKKLNKYYLKTEAQIQDAVEKLLGAQSDWFKVDIKAHQTVKQTKIGRGKIGADAKFKEEIQYQYELQWTLNDAIIAKQSRTDGLFPLVTNTDIGAKAALEKYKQQPYLEKRFNTLKSITQVAPMFLKLPRRIEAMLFLYFIALMVIALMERAIRNNMKQANTEAIPILPQKMNTKKPTWNNIRYFFDQVFFIALQNNEHSTRYIVKGLSKLHQKVLQFLGVPLHYYQINHNNWWRFNPS